MEENKVETPAPHGWSAVADIMETFAAFFFIAGLVSMRELRWMVIWFVAMAILLIGAGRIRARQRHAADRRDKRERKRRDRVRETLIQTMIIISPERIITLTELGAHVAIHVAVKDILEKYPDVIDVPMLGKEFIAKMDRRTGRPRVDRDIDALYEALAEEPIEIIGILAIQLVH